MVERWSEKPEVGGSIPPLTTGETPCVAPLRKGFRRVKTDPAGGKNGTTTAVGCGLQAFVEGPAGVGPDDPDSGIFFNPKYQADLTRYQADVMVTNTIGVAGLKRLFGLVPGSGSFIVSGVAKHGGTCLGECGGPVLLANGDDMVLLGVTSFGLNRNCAGVGGVYRVDQQEDLAFINGFLAL